MSAASDRAADEREAVADVERLELIVLSVLEPETQRFADEGRARYARYLALHALIDLTGRLMLSAIDVEPSAAPARCRAMVQQLDLLLTTAGQPLH